MIKLIIVLLFICIIKITISQVLEPLPEQYDCYLAIKNKFNLTMGTLSNGRINFCGYGACDPNGSITNFNLYATDIGSGVDIPNTQLTGEDLSCFPALASCATTNINVSPNFFSYPHPKLITGYHVGAYGFGGFTEANKPTNTFTSFYLKSSELDGNNIKMSWFNNVVFLELSAGYFNLEIDPAASTSKTILITFALLSFPDFTNFAKIGATVNFKFDSRLNVNSLLQNFKTTPTDIEIFDIDFGLVPTSTKYPLNVFATTIKPLTVELTLRNPNLEIPTSIVDFTAVKYRHLRFVNPGVNVHVNGQLPFKTPPATGIKWENGGLTVFPSFETMGDYMAILPINKMAAVLPSFPFSSTTLYVANFGNNLLTGTIDQSWCHTELMVANNQLTGTVPTCFKCYFGSPGLGETFPAMTNRFIGNSFTNMAITPCTTFAPQFMVTSNRSVLYYGIDIGYDPSNNMRFNGTIQTSIQTNTRKPGKQYTLNFSEIYNLYYTSYFNVTFKMPFPITYTFGLWPIPPSPSNVVISSTTQLSIAGTFFSSYYGQSIQSATIGGLNCVISSATENTFFKFICTVSTPLPTTDATQLLTITTGALSRKVYIKTTNTFVANNIVCPGYCTGSNGICNLTNGTCECVGRFIFDDCSGISCPVETCPGFSSCDHKIGECVCFDGYQGEDCLTPFIQCPFVNGNLCNAAGPCNNVTGECSCTDGNHQGEDCSIPFIQCPSANGNLCNAAGPCNNVTGECSCTDGSHQGIDCGTPFIQCPFVNGNLCNSAGPCNNVTGECSCTDGKHQGEDCSTPYFECPSANALVCSGYGSCNNITGSCSCISGRVLLDCTGIDCTPSDCSLNGVCNTLNGQCQCFENLWYGSDCKSPYHYITSVIPTSTLGGKASIFGDFGISHTDLYIQLDDNINHTITYISSTLLNFTVPPGNGIHDINVFQNGILFTGHKLFKYIDSTSIKQCPNQCSNSNQGQCSTSLGDCLCNDGFDSFDCSSLPYEGNSSLIPPKSTVSIDQVTGIPSLINELTNFAINIYSVKEIDHTGFAIRQFLLNNKWTIDEQSNSISQKLTGSSFIKSTITPATNEGSIELSISITNYPYSSHLNTLQLTVISTVDELDDNPCNHQNTLLDIYNSSNSIDNNDGRTYIKISKNEKIYSGRFSDTVQSDSRSTYLNSINAIKQPENSILVSISLPHCVDECIVKSDFTLYASLNYKSCSVVSINNKWKTPVIAVSVVVGTLSIASVLFYKYKKGALPSLSSSSLSSPSTPIKKRAISLKNRLTNSKVDLFMDDDKQ